MTGHREGCLDSKSESHTQVNGFLIIQWFTPLPLSPGNAVSKSVTKKYEGSVLLGMLGKPHYLDSRQTAKHSSALLRTS